MTDENHWFDNVIKLTISQKNQTELLKTASMLTIAIVVRHNHKQTQCN